MEPKEEKMSIFRQVQIIAGFFVTTGILGGYFLNLNFYFLSLFVGVMLMFAGVSDLCFMSMLLEKMPWNKK